MDKNAFLKELERSLSVLQEDEIRDIISEYEQHIDMKVQNGQTEEQAIADFGSLSELSADILEAYHVRADFAAGKKEKKFSFVESETAEELLQQTGEVCRKTGNGLVCLARRIGGWLKGAAGLCWYQLGRPAAWLKARMGQGQGGESIKKQHPAGADSENGRERGGGAVRTFMGGVKNGAAVLTGGCAGALAGAFRICLRALRWGIRACWNVCWGGFALCCTIGGLICLFGLGMLAVLWMQHYPLAGVTIGCLGLVLCFFSAAGYAVTLLWKPEKRNGAGRGLNNQGLHGYGSNDQELHGHGMNNRELREEENGKSFERKLIEVSAVPLAERGGGKHA